MKMLMKDHYIKSIDILLIDNTIGEFTDMWGSK